MFVSEKSSQKPLTMVKWDGMGFCLEVLFGVYLLCWTAPEQSWLLFCSTGRLKKLCCVTFYTTVTKAALSQVTSLLLLRRTKWGKWATAASGQDNKTTYICHKTLLMSWGGLEEWLRQKKVQPFCSFLCQDYLLFTWSGKAHSEAFPSFLGRKQTFLEILEGLLTWLFWRTVWDKCTYSRQKSTMCQGCSLAHSSVLESSENLFYCRFPTHWKIKFVLNYKRQWLLFNFQHVFGRGWKWFGHLHHHISQTHANSNQLSADVIGCFWHDYWVICHSNKVIRAMKLSRKKNPMIWKRKDDFQKPRGNCRPQSMSETGKFLLVEGKICVVLHWIFQCLQKSRCFLLQHWWKPVPKFAPKWLPVYPGAVPAGCLHRR